MYKKLLEHFKGLSAEYDNLFHEHFIETKYLSRIANNETDIIFGTKGTGKTALCRALTERNKDYYLNSGILDLESLSFTKFNSKLDSLQKTIQKEIHTLSRATWKNTLLNFSLLTLSEVLPQNELCNELQDILTNIGFSKTQGSNSSENSDKQISSTIDDFFRIIKEVPFKDSQLSGTSPEQDNVVNRFPVNDKISDILDKLIEIVKKTDKKILVCVDGLDSIVEHNEHTREIIFTGLIDAIYNLRLNKKISEAFVFKAFLPQELTLDSNLMTWDSDKHMHNVHYIDWNEASFKSFLLKRFSLGLKNTNLKFDEAWNEFFPNKITNGIYRVEEDTFQYILRHTLYRPRQIQNHIYKILSEWVEKTNENEKIQANFIPSAIARNNSKLAGKFAEQLSIIYPNFIPFMSSWDKSPTTITVEKMKSKIRRYLIHNGNDLHSRIDKIFDELYIFGLFGISTNDETVDFKTKSKKFHFSFVDDGINTSISNTIKGDDIIAFSPMLREYCGLKKENEFIIIPVAKNNYY